MTPVSTTPRYATGTIPSLDGIRAIAVTLVFCAHSGAESFVPGGLGVTLFFVLSGYLITTLMRMEHTRSQRIDFGGFYLRRLLRLMPPLFVVVAIAGLLSTTSIIDGGFTAAGLLSALFYYGNYFVIAHDFNGVPDGIGVVWSLAIEEHYYLFYPPIAALLLRIGRVGLSVVLLSSLCVIVLAWRYWLVAHGASEAYLTMATDTRIDAILIGCLLALARNPWLEPVTERSARRDWIVAAVCVLVLLGTLIYRDDTFRLTARYTLQSLSLAGLIYLAVARADRLPFRWLNARPLVYVGSISYTIYLSHHVVLSALAKHWPALGWLSLTLIGAALTLAVAEPMRRWIEEPCARLRKRLHRTPRDPRATAPAADAATANGDFTRHDASPETAIDAILAHDGPVLLDLDETLYLRNSTEDFIDSARPALLALLLMRCLDLVKPWRWTGGETTRDVWRVRAISWCFPRTARHWQNRVPELARRFANLRLLAALEGPSMTPIVATSGFLSVVTPLVLALGLPRAPIVAARLSTFADRRDGKLKLAVDALGDDTVRRALVLTDSTQDLTLLNACARPLRTIWPEARLRRALSGVYLPGQYLSQVKRPGTRYIVRGILQEDFALWVLCSFAFAAMPVLHVLGLLLLLISFWSVYEVGYVDNDLGAARFEADPKLTAEFHEAPVATPRWQPWGWALVFGTIAVFVLRWPAVPTPVDFVAWAGVLLATHGWFRMYNRFDKGTRVWLFIGLQLARAAAFVVLVPISQIAAIAIGAHVLAKWVPYCVYRIGGTDWPDAPFHLIRLLFFAVLAPLFAASQGISSLFNWTALALLAWMLYRARREIVTAFGAATRLDRVDQGRS